MRSCQYFCLPEEIRLFLNALPYFIYEIQLFDDWLTHTSIIMNPINDNQELKIQTKTTLRTNSLNSQAENKLSFLIEKIEGCGSTVHKAESIWKTEEKIKYLVFAFFSIQFIARAEGKDLWAVFKVMSNFIETKNSNQCRIYHKKMMKRFQTIAQMFNQILSQVPNFHNVASSYVKQLTNVSNSKNQNENNHRFDEIVKQEMNSDKFSQICWQREVNNEMPAITDRKNDVGLFFDTEKVEKQQQNIKTDVTILDQESRPPKLRPSIDPSVFQVSAFNNDFFQNQNQFNNSHSINPYWSGLMNSQNSYPFFNPYNSIQSKLHDNPVPQLSRQEEWRQCHQLYLVWRSKLKALIEKEQK